MTANNSYQLQRKLMQGQFENTASDTTSINAKKIPDNIQDYAEILNFYELDYKPHGYYLQVGKITKTQGWILHISAVISQVVDMYKTIIPLLILEDVPFKIVMSKKICLDTLHGYLGITQIGKVLSIYPNSDSQALNLAKKLITASQLYKGPDIPTDIPLGSVVYTRYGSFQPILVPNINGRDEKHIYNNKGDLIIDPYSVPFQLPEGVSWPFEELARPVVPASRQVLKQIYRSVSLLKSDVRGNVFKCVYLKSPFRTGNCVIKQGIKHMCAEDNGRDVSNRLIWQAELYQRLGNTIPMPEIYDLFQEDGNTYLVMEYINGMSLEDELKRLNSQSLPWGRLPFKTAHTFLDYLLTIISIIEVLHQKGYVHRDIVPVNFLIDRKHRLFLIDMELAYSLNDEEPIPPFEFGTAGFMSPEQQAIQRPTVKEDIYGLGALILRVLTGLSPIKFNPIDQTSLYKNIEFFINNSPLSQMICDCLNSTPECRPSISEIKTQLTQYKQQCSQFSNINHKPPPPNFDHIRLGETISAALNGLSKPPTMVLDDQWYSKENNIQNEITFNHKEYTRYVGINEGIGGVTYMLSRLKKAGFDIDTCMKGYKKGWKFIEEYYSMSRTSISQGLYFGSAGTAISLREGIEAGLLEDNENNRKKIEDWLKMPNTNLDLANGVAGQGIATINCSSFLNNENISLILDQHLLTLLDSRKNGSWTLTPIPGMKENKRALSFGYGIAGIIWFLLNYSDHYKNEYIQKIAHNALHNLVKKIYRNNNLLPERIMSKGTKFGEENIGLILLLMKAYEVLKDEKHKKLAAKLLFKIPSYPIRNNFTQLNGLAAMGELYLEASHVFKQEEWQQRANWIANIFIHTFKSNPDGSGYWQMEETNAPTADFMTGTSGIIHFLARCLEPDRIGYRILR